MIFYCDASLIVAVLVTEIHTAEARAWLGGQLSGDLAVSGWVAAEVASALARKQRTGALSPPERARAQRLWATALAPSMMSVDVRSADFDRVASLVDAGERGLRAADALHLAIAERHGLAVATLDIDLADAARTIGMDVPSIRRAT